MAQTASTTQILGLNQWNSPDDLNTTQFNEDNRLVDTAVGLLRADVLAAKNNITDLGGRVDEIKQELEEGDLTGIDDISRAILNRIYVGVDLTVKFADEVAAPPHNGNKWAWIQARIRAGNYEGFLVGDFIPFTIGAHTILAEIAGINTYTRYGDAEVPNHIDFISRDCFPDTRQFNRANYNNGTTVSSSPWLASDLFAWLNGLQQQVPNGTAANPPLVTADYRTTGLFPQLPAALRAVIVQKRLLLPTRFTAGALLLDDINWWWVNAGLLWIPSEVEVYGTNIGGGGAQPPQHGRATGGFVQYPIFAQNMKRVKGAGNGGARAHWWLLSAGGGASSTFAFVSGDGTASNTSASPAIRVPVCFRIA